MTAPVRPIEIILGALTRTVNFTNLTDTDAVTKSIRLMEIATRLAPVVKRAIINTHMEISSVLTLEDYRFCLINSPETAVLLNRYLELQEHMDLFEPMFSVLDRIQATASDVLILLHLTDLQRIVDTERFNIQRPLYSELWFALAPDAQVLDCPISALDRCFHDSNIISVRLQQIQKDNPTLYTEKQNQPYSLIPLNITVAQLSRLSTSEISSIARKIPYVVHQLLSEEQMNALIK